MEDLVLGGVFQMVAGVTSSAASRKVVWWHLSYVRCLLYRQCLETQKSPKIDKFCLDLFL